MSDPLGRFLPRSEMLDRSLLDRLLDLDPDLESDAPRPIGAQMREVKEGLRRDLEILLNTRRCPHSPPAEAELAQSLVSYGVDGFHSTSLVTDQQRREFAAGLERRIRACEPRLDDVRVTVLPMPNAHERALKLRIEASHLLRAGLPAVTFETVVDPSTQLMEVASAHE
ncbi:type VI secretion system baseplate subunit TssE [Xanthobacteraceae bacterium A53D]